MRQPRGTKIHDPLEPPKTTCSTRWLHFQKTLADTTARTQETSTLPCRSPACGLSLPSLSPPFLSSPPLSPFFLLSSFPPSLLQSVQNHSTTQKLRVMWQVAARGARLFICWCFAWRERSRSFQFSHNSRLKIDPLTTKIVLRAMNILTNTFPNLLEYF